MVGWGLEVVYKLGPLYKAVHNMISLVRRARAQGFNIRNNISFHTSNDTYNCDVNGYARMQTQIVIHFNRFAKHERRYMFSRLENARPWAFADFLFSRPPKKSCGSYPLTDDFRVLPQSHDVKFHF